MTTSLSGASGYGGKTGLGAGNTVTGGNVIPKGYQRGQLAQFSPEQMQLFQQMFSHAGPNSFLSRLAGGEQGMFEQLEAPALKQFGQLQGQIGSRYSQFAPGAMSAQRGSGFRNTLNQATSDFAEALQSQRLGLQRQAIQDLLGLSESLLGQRPNEQFLIKKQMPWWKQALLGINERGQDAAAMAAKFAMMA